MAAAEAPERDVTPADIRSKLEEINASVQTTTKAAAPVALAAGAGLVLAVIVVAYAFGRRRGRQRRTVVEIRRI